MTIITAAPFALIMILMCIALAKELRNDPLVHRDEGRARRRVRHHPLRRVLPPAGGPEEPRLTS
ncbi:MAG TPA: hypothetical protein VNP03_00845 [Pseudonocardia sp.]|nr:hypothetical protein [Pseudonocardia sp.]